MNVFGLKFFHCPVAGALLHASRAEMPSVNLDLAQRAEKAAAVVAGEEGFFLWMVEAAALVIEQERLRRGARLDRFEERAEHMHTGRRAAAWAGDRFRPVDRVLGEYCIA